MDIIDTAAEIEELQRNAALSAHRLNRNALSAERCEECDEPIPEPRRAAVPGCQTCAECQGVIELRNKQRGCDARYHSGGGRKTAFLQSETGEFRWKIKWEISLPEI
jgi:phage/conjugal plasmid C-4 type zinc finger TraR family protein